MQRGFSVLVETFTCALVMVARAQIERKARKRSRVAHTKRSSSAIDRIRSSYKYN